MFRACKLPYAVRHGPNSTHLLVRVTPPRWRNKTDFEKITRRAYRVPVTPKQTHTQKLTSKSCSLSKFTTWMKKKSEIFFRICKKETASDSKSESNERKSKHFLRGDPPGSSLFYPEKKLFQLLMIGSLRRKGFTMKQCGCVRARVNVWIFNEKIL